MAAVVNTAPASLEKIQSALNFVCPDDRDTWLRVAMAIKSEVAEEGEWLWHDWSNQASSYHECDAKAVWRSIEAIGKVSIGTLFHLAKENGWSWNRPERRLSAAEIAAMREASRKKAEAAAAEKAAEHTKAAERADTIWNAAQPAKEHAYLARKGVAPHGLRVGSWDVVIPETGEIRQVSNNALLVPIRDRTGRIHSLQAIMPNGNKFYLAGGAKTGNFYAIGKPQEQNGHKIWVLAEGFATAASIHEATGHAVLVCFDAGNLLPVAAAIRERQPDAIILLAADDDRFTVRKDGCNYNPGVSAATKAAQEVGGYLAVPQFASLDGEPSDWNDLACRESADVVAAQIAAALSGSPVQSNEEPPPAQPGPDKVQSADAGKQTQDRGELIGETGADCIADALLQNPTQDNVALVFSRKFKGQLLYAHAYACWLEWDGSRWIREGTDKAFDYARHLARRLNREGKTGPSSAAFCKGVEQFSRADRAFAVLGSEFDTNNYLLNTPAGTYDLSTNTLRPHDPNDRITKSTSVAPSAIGGERFKRFLKEITGDDESLAYFLQVSLGACLSGAVESHWMLFWTGTGRNGKNTLGDLVMEILGDYAKKIPSSTLMAKSYEAHPTEIANLQGARLAVSSEVADGDHWNEARINELSGDEILSGRFMRGDFFDFRRTHKHLIFGNHRPQLRTSTDALKSRIKIVPFTQSFVGREDPELPAALRREAGFVLYWLLEGHAAWLKAGRKLPVCPAIEKESSDYFESQSTVDAWVSERIDKIEDDGRAARLWPKAGELFADYRDWKQARGEQPISQTRWGETMAKTFSKGKADGIRYVGALLKSRHCA